MAVVFPSNPTNGQLFPASAVHGQPQWYYETGTGWNLISTAGKGTPVNIVLDVYSLAVQTSTNGAVDLSKAQARIITNSTSTAKAVTFANAPAGRAMTAVIEVVGNAGAISFPSGTAFAQNVDVTLSANRTVFVLYWNGAEWKVMSNTKM